ncbi:anti sigma factor C-terminal domain-containing protein [Candidatus Soleaferrea massiliensis]|uniref:anti sigma factor C-terminal domain-containing protein n=1 Tax=Candidatus Soleaferrea massiliensis TaxID=1470354 RepID=UPI0018CDEFF4|nr:anti sigma factor C-terminal domain-containing protein [Candidatus Soleaferrea massiliensis]
MKPFEDIVRRYLAGTASEEEIALVEEEVKKSELINELISQNILLELENSPADESKSRREVSRVRKKINFKIVRITLLIGMLALAVILTSVWAVDLYCKNSSYDPSVILNPDEDYPINKLQLDMSVYLELTRGLYVTDTTVTPRGFGNYDFRFQLSNRFDRYKTMVDGSISRNSLKEVQNNFNWPTSYSQSGNPPDELKRLPETAIVDATISVRDPIPYDDLWGQMVENLMIKYVKVQTIEFSPELGGQAWLGFFPKYEIPFYENAYDKERYPGLYGETELDPSTRLISMIQYIIDQKDFLEAFQIDDDIIWVNLSSAEYFKPAAEQLEKAKAYIEKNGVNICSMRVVGSCDQILELLDSLGHNVRYVSIDDVKLSEYAK